MYPTILDTQTGKTAIASQFDASIFWWSDGNGGCDCNRAITIGAQVSIDLGREKGFNNCLGNERFVAIDVHGDLEGLTKADILQEMNQDYPKELRRFWI